MDNTIIFWIGAIILFAVVEAATAGLTSIWFALGGAAALVTALLRGPFWLQIVWFLAVSIAAMIATRPLAQKYVNGKKEATNADRLLGRVGIVTEDIDNVAAKGAVKFDGQFWTARSTDGALIPAGRRVVARSIQGVKLIVEEEKSTTDHLKEE